MSDVENKSNKGEFKKTAHRPWKTPFQADFNLDSLDEKFSQLEAINLFDEFTVPDAHQIKQELKTAMQHTTTHPKQLSLGGFFKPQQLTAPVNNQADRKKNYLQSELKNKEQELHALTNNMQTSEAIERYKEAELNRRAEAHARIAAEKKLAEVTAQLAVAQQQCKLAEEHATHAIEHANRTIMHFLNVPAGSKYTLQVPSSYDRPEKIKIRVIDNS